jgi:hypothetical protein
VGAIDGPSLDAQPCRMNFPLPNRHSRVVPGLCSLCVSLA